MNTAKINLLQKKMMETYTVSRDILLPLPPFPKIMLIELTNRCNHRCSFCFNSRSTRKKGNINPKLLESILKEAYELGAREVGFYATGEPLLFKNIEQYIKLAKETGYDYIYITTNGALASPDKVKSLISAGLNSIKFSINAATRETYKLIHGKDDFDRVIENLKQARIFRDRNNMKFNIGVSCVLTDMSYGEKGHAVDTIGKIADDIVFVTAGNQGGYMNNESKSHAVRNTPCSMLFNRFHVSHEGYFTLCCVDYQNYLAVSDLNYTSLKDAWASKIAVDMRNKHLSSNIEGTLCYNCLMGKNSAMKPLVSKYSTVL
ncbi:MAG: radical SAM/SPASM domain-containing protein [Candidatus Omnitrophica bacterium]|nr:radical SAM/SPASM domain-containing protein [Candidatus Omnitrophota bacterium]